MKIGEPDIVVRAKSGVSGRLTQCIPIGEWRDRAYRVRKDLLKTWLKTAIFREARSHQRLTMQNASMTGSKVNR